MINKAFHIFVQAKFAYVGLILGWSKLSLLLQSPPKIISLRWSSYSEELGKKLICFHFYFPDLLWMVLPWRQFWIVLWLVSHQPLPSIGCPETSISSRSWRKSLRIWVRKRQISSSQIWKGNIWRELLTHNWWKNDYNKTHVM